MLLHYILLHSSIPSNQCLYFTAYGRCPSPLPSACLHLPLRTQPLSFSVKTTYLMCFPDMALPCFANTLLSFASVIMPVTLSLLKQVSSMAARPLEPTLTYHGNVERQHVEESMDTRPRIPQAISSLREAEKCLLKWLWLNIGKTLQHMTTGPRGSEVL